LFVKHKAKGITPEHAGYKTQTKTVAIFEVSKYPQGRVLQTSSATTASRGGSEAARKNADSHDPNYPFSYEINLLLGSQTRTIPNILEFPQPFRTILEHPLKPKPI